MASAAYSVAGKAHPSTTPHINNTAHQQHRTALTPPTHRLRSGSHRWHPNLAVADHRLERGALGHEAGELGGGVKDRAVERPDALVKLELGSQGTHERYKRRNEIERLFRRLKGFRRIFSRFEKLDVMFIAFINFALIVEALRSVNRP